MDWEKIIRVISYPWRAYQRIQAQREIAELERLAEYWRNKDCLATAKAMEEEAVKAKTKLQTLLR